MVENANGIYPQTIDEKLRDEIKGLFGMTLFLLSIEELLEKVTLIFV